MPKVTHHYEYVLEDDPGGTRVEIQLHDGKWVTTGYIDLQTVGPQDSFTSARTAAVKLLRQLADEVEREE